jgi:hypothetical protein
MTQLASGYARLPRKPIMVVSEAAVLGGCPRLFTASRESCYHRRLPSLSSGRLTATG